MENPFSEPSAREKSPLPPLRKPIERPVRQIPLAYILMALGVVIFAVGFPLFARNNASNAEQDFAFMLLGIGIAFGVGGVSLRFLHPLYALLAALIGPPLAWIMAAILCWACLILNGLLTRFL